MYLTFDDGPHPIQTPKILSILKAYNAKACFFCIGSKVVGNEALLKRIYDEGHLIGNHSFTHSGLFPLYSKSKMNTDLNCCDELLSRVIEKPIYLFRPPFGVTNPTIARIARDRGYQVIGWNIRTLDTQGGDISRILKRIKKRIQPGSVILLHDRLDNSDQILLKTLDFLQEQGYRFDNLPESAFRD